MKITNNILFRAAAAAVLLVSAAACAVDDTIEIKDFDYDAQIIYLKQPLKTAYNMEYRAIPDGYEYTADGIADDVDISYVLCTKPAPKDISVGVAIDHEYVEKYNAEETAKAEEEQREPKLLAIPQNVELESSTVVIKKGEYTSAEPVRIHCINHEDFQTGGEDVSLVVPVKIISTNEGKVSSVDERNVVCMKFASKFVSNNASWSSTAATTHALQIFENGDPRNGLREAALDRYIRLTYPAAANTTVKLKIDYSLIASSPYSSAQPLTKASLNKTTLTIAEGELRTSEEDGVKLLFSDGMAEMVSGTNYVVPIVIEQVSGFGLETPATQNVIYYYITTSTFIPNWVRFSPAEKTWSLNFSNEDGSKLNAMSRLNFEAVATLDKAVNALTYVYLAVDNSLVAQYNKEHSTDYEVVPETLSIGQNYIYIPRNQVKPTSTTYTVQVTFSESMATLQKGHKYLVPVVVSRIECDDKNVAVSEGADGIFYGIIETAEVEPPLIMSTDGPNGTMIPRDDIKAHTFLLSSLAKYADWTNNVKGAGTSSSASLNGTSYGLEIDLGAEYNLSGMLLNVYSASYGFRVITLEVSTDQSQWTDLGESSVLAQATEQYVKIRKPAQARYIRLRVQSGWQSNGTSKYVYFDGKKGIIFYQQ